jgi:hypothetical protein
VAEAVRSVAKHQSHLAGLVAVEMARLEIYLLMLQLAKQIKAVAAVVDTLGLLVTCRLSQVVLA